MTFIGESPASPTARPPLPKTDLMNAIAAPPRTSSLIALCYTLAWASFVVINAANMPLMDDYDAVLQFLNDFSDSDAWGRATLLMAPHNEHRIATTRGAALVGYLLSGTANFTWLILVGTALWMVLAWCFIRDAARYVQGELTVPLVAIFLNLRYATLVNWAMAGVPHYMQALFGFLSIACLCTADEQRPRWRSWIGYAAIYLSVFTSGAGILVIPAIALHCLLAGNYRRLAIVAAHAAFIVLLTTTVFAAESTRATNLNRAFSSPVVVTEFTLNFCGNLLPARLPCEVLGAAAFALMSYGVTHHFHRRYPEYFYTALLQILIGVAAAVARVDFGAQYGLESKYSVYAIVLWAALLTMFWRHLRDPATQTSQLVQQAFLVGTYALTLIACGCSWAYNRTSIENLARVHWIVHPNVSHARDVLNTSSAKGIYDGSRYISNAKQ